ncbi:tyrosine-type recombinase/integrase, partial [Streptomyces fradiae]|uniref:tyrosine-type recombinase/integrase n=1 Tax=Streptomyces fradiae TaxID=1906 RepID=UPI00358DB579
MSCGRSRTSSSPRGTGRRSSRNFNRTFTDRSGKAGVRRIRLHDTRHTCGSLLAALDVHPRIAMQILRHSKIAVTMEVYTHVPSEATRKALRKLRKHLGRQSDVVAVLRCCTARQSPRPENPAGALMCVDLRG